MFILHIVITRLYAPTIVVVTPEISLSAGKTFQTTFVQCVYTFMFTVQHACKGGIHDGPTPLDMCKFKLQPTHANYTRIQTLLFLNLGYSFGGSYIYVHGWEIGINVCNNGICLSQNCPPGRATSEASLLFKMMPHALLYSHLFLLTLTVCHL